MNVYTANDWRGHYPVGAAAVIVAETHEQAKVLLEARLAAEGLAQDVPLDEIYPLDMSTARAFVLVDGNY